MKNIKVYTSINEWKESDNYIISKWFNDMKKSIEKIFEKDVLSELEYDYFEYDASRYDELYVGQLFFNEDAYQYKLTILLDYKDIQEDGNVSMFNIKFDGYNNETSELIGTINREDIEESELNENFIIDIINDFKNEYLEDETEIDEL